MSSSDKKFEELLVEAGNKLLDPPASVEELLPLLDKVEHYLSRVEQSPSKSIEDALSPSIKALIADKLFRHPDTDVMVAVASCISEITRITAPDAPYTDEEMKEAFQLIVSSFEHLDDMRSRSYARRASILETVAKVRSCVVMLDLECDDLLVKMFQHFLKTIRDYHPEPVFSSMETIMTLVIEEGEDICPELLSPILETLKKDNEGALPIAKKLGEKVLQKCSTELKPYLDEALASLGTHIDDYCEVLKIISQAGDDENKTDTTAAEGGSAENKNDDVPAGEHETENGAASPKSEVNNGVKETAEYNSKAAAVSSKQPENVLPKTKLKITGLTKKDRLNKSDTEKEAKTAPKSKKKGRKRRQRWSLTRRSTKPTSISSTVGKKKPGQSVENGEEQPTEANLLIDGGEKADVARPPEETATESLDVSSPSKSEEPKKKEGSLKESAGPGDTEVKEKAGPGKKPGGGASNEDRTPIKVKISRKARETTDNAKTNSVTPSTEKVTTSSSDKDGSSLKSLKVKDKKGPAKVKKVHQKDMAMSSEKDADEEKEVHLSKATKKRQRNEDQPAETPKEKGKRKRHNDEEQPAETLTDKLKRKRTPAKEASNVKEYGGDLVGYKVKVWWPKDKAFYEGVVDAYDAVKKKHTILYNDGDIETLYLKRQKWEIIPDEDSGPNEEQGVAEETRESSPDLPLRMLLEPSLTKKLSARKTKGVSSKKSEVVTPASDHRSKKDASLETDTTGGKAKDNNTPNIGSKLVGLARKMTSKSKETSENKTEENETKKDELEKSQTISKGRRTPKSMGGSKKVKSDGSDKVKSTSSRTKPKASEDVVRDSGEQSDKVKSTSSKPKVKESKEVDIDSGEETLSDDPSDKVKSSAVKTKPKVCKGVDSNSGELPTDKVKSSSRKLKSSKESKEADKEKPSSLKAKKKTKSSSLKPKSKESEDVDMGSREEPSNAVKSSSSKIKPKDSKKVAEGSGEEPSDKEKDTLSKPEDKETVKQGEEAETEEVDKQPSGEASEKEKPEPKENEEVGPAPGSGSGEEAEENSSEKQKPVAESVKGTASGRRSAKKRRRGA